MAEIVVQASASLSANGTSTATGSITWTAPSLPDGISVWDSVIISGSWSWSGKGSISRVTINGVNTSEDNGFSVSLGANPSPPLSITCVGGNKNATGANFAWSNLQVSYQYSPSKAISVKQNGSWVQASEVYKKVNGAWVKQSNLENVFETGKSYVKG